MPHVARPHLVLPLATLVALTPTPAMGLETSALLGSMAEVGALAAAAAQVRLPQRHI